MRFFFLLLISCLISSTSLADPLPYRGWSHLAQRLIAAGIPATVVHEAFNDERLPEFDFVPFTLKPKETSSLYSDHVSEARVTRATEYLQINNKIFHQAEKIYGVNRYLVAAIHSIETGCGKVLGQELVFNRLARVASASDPKNLQRNFKELSKLDEPVTIEEVVKRSAYLDQTFFPEIKALFDESMKGNLSLFELRGSYGGAFGIGQFLPLAYQNYGTDGNRNGVISLFETEDAIYSTARFLHSFGWKESLPAGEKLKLLWHYNRSDPYGRAVIKLSIVLKQRVPGRS